MPYKHFHFVRGCSSENCVLGCCVFVLWGFRVLVISRPQLIGLHNDFWIPNQVWDDVRMEGGEAFEITKTR